jgi:hypothetical protein
VVEVEVILPESLARGEPIIALTLWRASKQIIDDSSESGLIHTEQVICGYQLLFEAAIVVQIEALSRRAYLVGMKSPGLVLQKRAICVRLDQCNRLQIPDMGDRLLK